MGKYLKINRDEACLLAIWFEELTVHGHDFSEDFDLNKKIEKFIDQEREKQEDGKRVTENNQRKQTD